MWRKGIVVKPSSKIPRRNSWTAVDQIDADSAVRTAKHITVKTNTSHSIIS